MNPLRSLLGRPLPPRVSIVGRELGRFARPRYLEIGVNTGVVFTHVRARQKVGVDPVDSIPRWKWLAHPNTAVHGILIEKSSDEYFATLDPEARFDVVFVDGYHSYTQALRDVENSLRHLADGGVVLLHDVNPPDAVAASPDMRDAVGGPWCGDAWKAIVHLRATRPDLSVGTIDADFGIGVVRRRMTPAPPPLDLEPAVIAALRYEDLAADRAALLGLRAP